MLLRSIEYVRPSTVADAVAGLGSTPGARAVAGGQSLVNVNKHRVAAAELLVDISRLEELRGIEAGADGSVTIGAAVTYDELDRSDAVRRAHPKIAHVASRTVDQQVRCRGTIGGNCCYNDPSSNFPPLMVALGATMRIAGPDGQREVSADEFFFGPFDTAVRQGELLHSIVVPALRDDEGVGYCSLQLAKDSWALARACAVVRANGTIESARIALGCVIASPMRATAMEQRLQGARPDAETVAAAASLAREGAEAVSDVHASADYRLDMAAVVAKRAVLEATDKEGR
jgi:carbon-monoxide dehydrogenase medium subunit